MLHRLLHSDDRFQILRGLEILGSLATVESNEEILVNALGKDAFNRVTELLTGKSSLDSLSSILYRFKNCHRVPYVSYTRTFHPSYALSFSDGFANLGGFVGLSIPDNQRGPIALLSRHVRDDAKHDVGHRALQLSAGSEAAGN